MQQTLLPQSGDAGAAPDYHRWMPLIVFSAALVGFIAAPWPLHDKAHAVLHGLCAQTPGHTFSMGGNPLPFDARMTGIYAGTAAVLLSIGARTKFRFAALPSWTMMGFLAVLVAVMALDGFNSLFLDLQMWHPYTPNNWLRVITGIGAGVALGATLAFLIGATLWRDIDERNPVIKRRDLLGTSIGSLVFAGLLASGMGWLYPIMTMFLILAALFTVCSIVYLMIVLIRETNNRHSGVGDVGIEGAVGVIAGIAVVALLACGRFALERWLGIPISPA